MGTTVKLADVAKAAGVSQGTVSNVFNRPDLVSDELRQRVVEVAASLGYRGPDPRGRMLRAGRVGAIGVVTADRLSSFFADPYARRFMTGIALGCEEHDVGLSVVSSPNDERAAWNVRTALVDGFIVNCFVEGTRLVDLAAERGLPFVAVDFSPGGACDVVRIDDRAAARIAAEHLLGLGHRRLAVVTLEFDSDDRSGFAGPERWAAARYATTRGRLAGYQDAFAAAGIDPATVPVYETFNDRPTVDAAVDAILERNPDTTGFLCMSDVSALEVIRRLREHGRRVPEDASVFGFDDTDEGRWEGLTTIRQPAEEKGRAAARLVLDPPAEGVGGRDVVLPFEPMFRRSTGQAPR